MIILPRPSGARYLLSPSDSPVGSRGSTCSRRPTMADAPPLARAGPTPTRLLEALHSPSPNGRRATVGNEHLPI
eukprot:10815540-Alexandrium_andersonii.AAC.1